MPKILIVDDEENLRNGLKDNFEFEGYEVLTAEDGLSGYEVINKNQLDLIILDVMMPKLSGTELCKKIRKDGNNTPVIFLTAKGEEIDKVLGLELGADDYVTKPFSLRELLARVKSILRRNEFNTQNNKITTIGKLQIDFSTFSVSNDSGDVTLSLKEFELLKYLWENKSKTIPREELLKNVWGDVYITSRTIDNFIVKLRQKVEFNPENPKIILTVHGIGYKLII